MVKHNHFLHFTLPVAFFCGIYAFVSIYFGYIVEKQSFENFLTYVGPFLTGIGIVFGLLGVVTLYYLGKFHDSKKDSIKITSEFDLTRKKLETLTEEPNADKKSLENNKDVKMMDETMEEYWDILKKIPNDLIITSLWISLFYVITIIRLFYLISEPSLNYVILAMTSLISGIGVFIFVWLENEHLLSSSENILRGQMLILNRIKHLVYTIEINKIKKTD